MCTSSLQPRWSLIALAGLAVNVSDRVSAPNSSIWPSAWSIQEEERARVAQELLTSFRLVFYFFH
jgi:hypothetical protein